MISKKAFEKCLINGLTIAFAESMTGGSLAYEMIKNPGSSSVVSGGIVAYSLEQKIDLLNIDSALINQHSVVSKEVAEQMARSIRSIMKTDIGVSVTGNAGPSVQANTQQLEAWIAIDFHGVIKSFHLEFSQLTRLKSIKKTVEFTFQKLIECF